MTGNKIAPNNGRGRPKGALNKTTANVKSALTEAFEKMGGVPSLVKWGKKNPTEFYKLMARLIPVEVTGKDGGPVQVQALTVTFVVAQQPERDAQV